MYYTAQFWRKIYSDVLRILFLIALALGIFLFLVHKWSVYMSTTLECVFRVPKTESCNCSVLLARTCIQHRIRHYLKICKVQLILPASLTVPYLQKTRYTRRAKELIIPHHRKETVKISTITLRSVYTSICLIK